MAGTRRCCEHENSQSAEKAAQKRIRIVNFKRNPKTKFKSVDKLSEKQAAEQIDALREAIDYHDYLYYVKNKPRISDAEYDKLFKRLQELEEAFPMFQSPNSPTKRVGGKPVDKLKKVKHTRPMLSINAALEEKEIKNFVDYVSRNRDAIKVEYALEPKFDGLSVEIVYENGEFKYGSTRGDGRTGEDISDNLKTVRSVPLRLRADGQIPAFMAVRGEVYLPKSYFTELNKRRIERGMDTFANPRNAAAGIVRQLDPKNVADKQLDIVFYEVLQIEDCELDDHWAALKQFPKWGLKTDSHNAKCSSFKKIRDYHDKLARQRDELEYELDGIVIKVNDRNLRERLGTRQRSPRWAMAWKFEPKVEVTTLQDIVVQVGRTGMLTPVALLEPVDVGGVTVSRATLHNEGEVRKKDIRPGDKVRIQRAGDVIPEVVESIKKPGKKRPKPFSMPKKCPVCGSKVHKEGAYYFCSASLSCRGQLVGRIIHFASREAMNIEGLGDETVKQLVNREMVKEIADLYKLSADRLQTLEGFAEKSAKQLQDAIQKTKTVRLDRFLYALGIRHVGEHIAQVLARRFQTMENIQNADCDDLNEVPEVGPEIARSIVDFFNEKKNRQALQHLFEAGVKTKTMPKRKKGEMPLEGKTFVFTGELDKYARSDAEDAVEQLGAKATSSVSSSTDYVVAGENPGSKLDEGKKRNVKIINEKEFEKILQSE
jgi:DNA ligase (NAD+)